MSECPLARHVLMAAMDKWLLTTGPNCEEKQAVVRGLQKALQCAQNLQRLESIPVLIKREDPNYHCPRPKNETLSSALLQF